MLTLLDLPPPSASLTRLDTEQKQHSANYAGGEKAGQSWTEKVMGVKQTQEPPKTLPQDLQEGVEEEEWVSGFAATDLFSWLPIEPTCALSLFLYTKIVSKEEVNYCYIHDRCGTSHSPRIDTAWPYHAYVWLPMHFQEAISASAGLFMSDGSKLVSFFQS